MYETIKTVEFGDYTIRLVKSMTGVYYAECDERFYNGSNRLELGPSLEGAWEKLSEELGEDDVVEADELLELVDKIEEKLVYKSGVTLEMMRQIIEEVLMEQPRLFQAYIPQEIEYVLKRRFVCRNGEYKLPVPGQTTAEWLMDCVETKRIFRITTEEYEEQTAYVKHFFMHNDQYFVEFALVDITEKYNEDGNSYNVWGYENTLITNWNDIVIERYIIDDLPPEYQA